MKEIYSQLKQFGKVKTNEPLSKHTTFKIGGEADFLVEIDSVEKLIEVLHFLRAEGVEYFVLGGGSNLLVSDNGFKGVVVKMKIVDFRIENDVLIAGAGCSTVAIAQESMKARLTGFEWGVGVPGTMGGATRGNAGAMGGEMKDNVEKVEVYRDGEIVELNNKACKFGYRDSVFKHNRDIILRVYLKLEKTKNKELIKKALEYLKYRNETQPQGYSSTGCIFKNVSLEGSHGEAHRVRLLQHFDSQDEKVKEFLHREKISAGWLVEQAGLKGLKIGNAMVSDKHGNFVLNLGGSTASEVKEIIEKIKGEVYDKFGIELEEEIKII